MNKISKAVDQVLSLEDKLDPKEIGDKIDSALDHLDNVISDVASAEGKSKRLGLREHHKELIDFHDEFDKLQDHLERFFVKLRTKVG